MDKKQKLEELENEYKKLGGSLASIQMQVMSFERSADYDEYNKTEEADKEAKYPEAFAMYKQKAELESNITSLSEKIKAAVSELYKEVEEKIEKFEKKIQFYADKIEATMEEIKAQNKEIIELKETEEYKNGDEETVLKVEKLEIEMKAKVLWKNGMVKKLAQIRKDINQLEADKTELVAEYGEEIKPVKEVTTPANEEAKPKTETEPTKKGKDKDEEKDKPKKNTVVNGPAVQTVPNTESEAEKAKKEKEAQAAKEAKLKEDFKGIYKRAKKGNLTQEDFDKIAEIMKNPDNYDKLGITTGSIFGKSKAIFKAMDKFAAANTPTDKDVADKLKAELEEAKGVYNQVRIQRAKGKWYSWIYEFDEQKPALPAENTEKPAPEPAEKPPKTLGETLAGQTVENPDYEAVSTGECKVEPQEQSK